MVIAERVYPIVPVLLNALKNTQFFAMMAHVGQLKIYVLSLLYKQNVLIKKKLDALMVHAPILKIYVQRY